MDYTILEKVICEMIKEEQIKLGYEKETIRLYYPMSSLAGVLGANVDDTSEMDEIMKKFINTVRNNLGEVRVTHSGERYCIAIPPEGVAYVHENLEDNPFLISFVDVIRTHDCTLEHILEVFYRFSEQVTCEESDIDEFDYVIYFAEGKPDDYRYCIKFDSGHTVYHRFTRSDFMSL